MSDMVLVGGTVVTAEASFRADVAVEDERIAAVGVDLPTDGAEVVDVSGALLMPGFIDGHTHLDMPFGGTVTSDDWDTGTAAAVAGGTTTKVDFSLQDIDGTLAEAVETWQGRPRARRASTTACTWPSRTSRTPSRPRSLAALARRSTIKIFMAYKGTPLYTADEDLFEAMQIAREAGVLVLVHAENGDVIAKLQAEALERGDTDPHWHASRARAGRGRGDQPRHPPGRDRRHAAARRPRLVRRRARGGAPRPRAREHDLRRDVPAVLRFEYADLERPDFEGAKYVCSPPMRDPSNRPALWRGLRLATCRSSARTTARSTGTARRSSAATTSLRSPTACPGLEERPAVLWTEGVRGGHISEQLFVAVLSTNQARVHGMVGRKGAIVPGNDADIVVWDPDMTITATQSNRHNRLDHTPYEGKTLIGGPTEVYIRGALAYRDGEVVAEAGSGRFIERAFRRAAPAAAVR